MKVIFLFISFHPQILPLNTILLFFEMIKNFNACFPRKKMKITLGFWFLYFWLWFLKFALYSSKKELFPTCVLQPNFPLFRKLT